MWPQVTTKGVDSKAAATAWIATLRPYGLEQINWICPTQQKLMQNPDLSDPDNARIDYVATPFDRNPMTPMRWAKQPWFVESGDVHGNGNLLIFPDGTHPGAGRFSVGDEKSPGVRDRGPRSDRRVDGHRKNLPILRCRVHGL